MGYWRNYGLIWRKRLLLWRMCVGIIRTLVGFFGGGWHHQHSDEYWNVPRGSWNLPNVKGTFRKRIAVCRMGLGIFRKKIAICWLELRIFWKRIVIYQMGLGTYRKRSQSIVWDSESFGWNSGSFRRGWETFSGTISHFLIFVSVRPGGKACRAKLRRTRSSAAHWWSTTCSCGYWADEEDQSQIDCTQSLSFLLVIERLKRVRCATARETGVRKVDGRADYCGREKKGTACSLSHKLRGRESQRWTSCTT